MENYEEAAESRLHDLDVLIKEKRKVGTIHFGGIYIECLLKGMICMEHSVTDGSTKGKWVVDTIEQSRPKHELKSPAHLALLPSLYDDMPDEVADALDYITEPEGITYIDYRYIPEEQITEEIYNSWMERFLFVFDYLESKKHEI